MPFSHLCLAVLVAAIWGFNFVALRWGLTDFPPMVVLALRYLVAIFPLIFFIPRPKNFKLVILFALFVGMLQFPLLMYAMKLGASAGLASVIMQTQVFFSVILGSLIYKEKITTGVVIGLISAAIGIGMLATLHDDFITPFTIFLMIIGALCWALGNLTARSAGNIDALSFTVWSSLIPPVPLLLASVYFDGFDTVATSILNINFTSFLVLLWLGYPATLFSWFAWSWLIKKNGVGKIAPSSLLVPITGMIGSSIFFGETFTSFKILAIGFVVTGLGFAIIGGKSKKAKNLTTNVEPEPNKTP